MEKSSKGIINRIQWIYKLIRHGLFMQGVRNNLAKLGLDIMPYYHFVATKENAKPQVPRGENLNLEMSFFDASDMALIKDSIIGIEEKDFLADLESGDVCVGLKNDNEIVGYTLAKRKSFYFRKRYFHLDNEDIYLHSLYVFDKYRGRNIAPYMKYKRFEIFETEGVIYHHAIVEYFNTSALKIQYKASAKKIALYLNIILFKKWTLNYTLETY